MELKVGDAITWKSAAGTLSGIIYCISLSKTADGKISPWMDVSLGKRAVRLCGNDSYIKMMKITKN